jgi:hypothetical protein
LLSSMTEPHARRWRLNCASNNVHRFFCGKRKN